MGCGGKGQVCLPFVFVWALPLYAQILALAGWNFHLLTDLLAKLGYMCLEKTQTTI